MTKNKIISFYVLFLSAITVSSCMNEKLNIANESYFTSVAKKALSSSLCETAINEADALIIDYYKWNQSKQADNKQNLATTIQQQHFFQLTDSGSYPKKILIDFGASGYKNDKGISLVGQVYVTFYDIACKLKYYTFTNLSIDGDRVTGEKTVEVTENKGFCALKITIREDIIYSNQQVASRISERIRTRTNDNGTPDIYTDDSYECTGNASGVNTNGVVYSVIVDKPLVLIPEWKYYISGTITTTTPEGKQTLDFGNGELDNEVTSIIGNKQSKITLNW